ncbi:hypothetical protein ACIQUQ_04770 [Streptomyces sp. NPDC101118]|uniref:hypothetical protein n=1 Tax=Streptomyces sp. NPDC101118 TaxID=3366109 RepID=UPI003810BEB0
MASEVPPGIPGPDPAPTDTWPPAGGAPDGPDGPRAAAGPDAPSHPDGGAAADDARGTAPDGDRNEAPDEAQGAAPNDARDAAPNDEHPDTSGRTEEGLARWLLRSVLADPGHLPEILASFASRRLGTAAARTVAKVRADHPDARPEELRGMVANRGRRIVVTEGSFVGGPFIVVIPFAFCAALLAQLRMCLELGALAGRPATSPDRTAELLVIQGVYPDIPTAGEALEKLAARTDRDGDLAPPPGPRPSRVAALWSLVKRMAYLLGLLGPEEDTSRLIVKIGRWALVGLVFLVGLVAPLVWIPYLGWSYHRSTGELAARTVAFYGAATPAEAAEAVAEVHPAAADPGMIAAALRTLSSLLVPVGAVILVFVAAVDDSRWPLAAVTVTVLSLAVGAIWYLRHRMRHRRPSHD